MIEINNKSYNFVFQRFSCEFDIVYLVLFCAFGVNMKEFLGGLICNHLMELKQKKLKKDIQEMHFVNFYVYSKSKF